MGNLGWINGNLVDWMCRYQKVVTLSTMEAEYIGYCSSARNATHLAQLLQPFRTEPVSPVIIWGDNAAAKTFAEKDMINQKTKHIGIAYHYVREKVMEGFINIVHISTNFNFADILTKPLTSEKTRFFCSYMIGMIIAPTELFRKFRPQK